MVLLLNLVIDVVFACVDMYSESHSLELFNSIWSIIKLNSEQVSVT